MATAGSPKILIIPGSHKESEEFEEPMTMQYLTVQERLLRLLSLTKNFLQQLKQLLMKMAACIGFKKTLFIKDSQREEEEEEEAEREGEREGRVGADRAEPVMVPLRGAPESTPHSSRRKQFSLYKRSHSLEELPFFLEKETNLQARFHSGNFTPDSISIPEFYETISTSASHTKLLD